MDFLPFSQCNTKFCISFFTDKQIEWHNRQSNIFDLFVKFFKLFFLQKQLAVFALLQLQVKKFLHHFFSIEKAMGPISNVKVTLWGPTTNVFRSWYELASLLGFELVHVCDAQFHERLSHVRFSEHIDARCDVIITDSWPANFENTKKSLNATHLEEMGNPKLLPTPPFFIGHEIAIDPLHYEGFMGYDQKIDLINRPDRVFVGIHLHRRRALAAHMGSSILAIMIGLWVDRWLGIFNFFASFM